MVETVKLQRGLKDVYIDRTESSFIDGQKGKLIYRGYNIHDLAEKSTFEETIYLLFYGHLPTLQQLHDFNAQLHDNREIPREILEIIRFTKNGHPMDVLRSAISAISTFDPEVNDNSHEATIRKGVRLTAMAPTIVCAHHQIRNGREPINPSGDLDHAGNFMYMLTGEKPNPEDAKLMDRDFVLHADHGVNASAFAARLAASTEADLHSAVTAGIAVLKGPRHGGAAESVMKMALEIGEVTKAEEYVKRTRASGGRVMGFGHRVYKTVDPRSIHLQSGCKALGERKGQPNWFSILTKVADLMEPYAARGIAVNVDFWSGAIYYLLGIPEDLFISIFAMGRIPGWTVQVTEQFTNNILLRPRLHYVGPMDLEYVPIENRV